MIAPALLAHPQRGPWERPLWIDQLLKKSGIDIALRTVVQAVRSGPTFAGPRWAISTELAAQAIHAERVALDALGTLQPSAVGMLPAVQIGGGACRIDVLGGPRRTTGVMKISPTNCVTNGGESGEERRSVHPLCRAVRVRARRAVRPAGAPARRRSCHRSVRLGRASPTGSVTYRDRPAVGRCLISPRQPRRRMQ